MTRLVGAAQVLENNATASATNTSSISGHCQGRLRRGAETIAVSGCARPGASLLDMKGQQEHGTGDPPPVTVSLHLGVSHLANLGVELGDRYLADLIPHPDRREEEVGLQLVTVDPVLVQIHLLGDLGAKQLQAGGLVGDFAARADDAENG